MSDEHDRLDLELRRAVSHLPRSIAPKRDLWAGIQEAMSNEGAASSRAAPRAASERESRRLNWVWGLAASVLGIAIGVSVTLAVVQRQAPPPIAAHVASDYTFVPASTNRVRTDLRRDAMAQLAKLPPNTRAHVEADLATITKALTDIQSALAKDPGNSLLQDLLVTTYQDELNTLANVQALASSVHPGVST